MSSSLVQLRTRYVFPHTHGWCSDGDRMLQAAKAYEQHQARNGKPDSHAKAKELLYG